LRYFISQVPLNAVTPAAMNVNLLIHGGILRSEGLLEYAPKIARVEVDNGYLDDVDIEYVHTPQTDIKERQNVNAAGQGIEKQNNKSDLDILIKEFQIRRSEFAYVDREKNPNFKVFLSDSQITLKNYSNHEEQGPAQVTLRGKFLGTGQAKIDATFLAEEGGPHLDANLAIENTDMTAMNNLLLAFGRFDVKQGVFTVFSQLNVKNGEVSGYVKPMFSNLKIYDWQKDKSKPILHQAYELGLAGASHIFKNGSTQQVATKVDLSGKLKNPNANTWQAIVEIVQNAFIQAILPGFDRQAQLARNQSP
jgi:hypothetical protein